MLTGNTECVEPEYPIFQLFLNMLQFPLLRAQIRLQNPKIQYILGIFYGLCAECSSETEVKEQ